MTALIISICLGLLNSLQIHSSEHSNNSENKVSNIRMLDISQDTTIQKIITDFISADTINNNENFYFLVFSKYKDGILIKCAMHNDVNIKNTLGFIGYALLDGKTILFDGDNSYKIKFANPAQIIQIKKNSDWKDGHYPVYTYYYMIDDIFAKFDPETGWIWSDREPDK